jgi:hypothetical protein
VESLKVNEKKWAKNWLTWSDVFANGGTMEFFLDSESTEWATGSPPPSPATESSASTERIVQSEKFISLLTLNA